MSVRELVVAAKDVGEPGVATDVGDVWAAEETAAIADLPQFEPRDDGTAVLRIYTDETIRRKDDGGVDRSAALLQIARVLHGSGVSWSRLIAALAERDEALGWRKYSDRADVQRQYERLADLVTHDRR